MGKKRLTVRADEIRPGDSVWRIGEVIEVQCQSGPRNIRLIGINGTAEVVGEEELGITR